MEKSPSLQADQRDLGFAMAAGLASAGAKIMLVNRNADEGTQAAKELATDYGIEAISFSADVSDLQQTEAMAKAALETFGKIDILINSAGINIRGAIDEVSLEDFNKVMHVNVTGTWLCSRAVIPYMKKNKSGKIINLASTLGLVGLANRTPYTSSKGAVVQMTRALALELAPFNINVNALCPGPFLTDMNFRSQKPRKEKSLSWVPQHLAVGQSCRKFREQLFSLQAMLPVIWLAPCSLLMGGGRQEEIATRKSIFVKSIHPMLK